jgi:putative ABC transport system permease protein
MDALVRDLRYALRQLRNSPGYAALAIISIGIGIGATTTIFSLVEAFLLRPIPAPRADRLVYAYETSADGSGFHSFSFLQYKDLRDRSRALPDLAAFDITPLSVATTGDAQLAVGFSVSGNFFKTFGATPALGRFFLPEEDAFPDVGTHPVAVVSHAFWERRLAADTTAVGRTIRLNGRPFTVVGVARPEMSSVLSFIRADVWTPIAMSGVTKPGLRLDSRDFNSFQLVGRLADGITRRAAERELEAIAKQIEADHPEATKGRGVDLFGYSGMPPEARMGVSIFMALLMSFSLLILLVACGNLAGVIMARAVQRRRELAVRVALGAARATLVRQLVTETVVLFLGGCVAAIGIASVATRAIAAFRPPISVPIELDIRVDARVIEFALALGLVVGVLFALVPAFRATRLGVMNTLKEEGGTASRRSRSRNVVVVAQLAFTLLLLIDAALVARALRGALDVNPGFEVRDMRIVATDLQMRGYGPEAARRLLDQWRAALLTQPGVRDVAFTSRPPLDLGNSTLVVRTTTGGAERAVADFATVSNEYFRVMRIPLAAGRTFTTGDGEGGEPVAVVSAALARRFFASPASAIGRTIRVSDEPRDRFTIVGVTPDTKVRSLAESPRLMMYLPIGQSTVREVSALIRGDVVAAAGAARSTLRGLDPDLPLMGNTTFEQHIGLALLPQRLAGVVSATLGAVGLLLAAIGVYGIVAYAVSQRIREIGIRVAVGATPAGVARFMAGEGVRVAAVGVAIGLALALGGAQLLRTFLLGMNPYDPLAFGGAALGLLGVAIAACVLPARRAARVDPVVALRAE